MHWKRGTEPLGQIPHHTSHKRNAQQGGLGRRDTNKSCERKQERQNKEKIAEDSTSFSSHEA